mmetsp:Transcript_22814/g.36663  ORF Transcript_22814/g.36663 Transcript_22814/m.36663 type:complete len:222 (-) Transcript_22814:17-682(-)
MGRRRRRRGCRHECLGTDIVEGANLRVARNMRRLVARNLLRNPKINQFECALHQQEVRRLQIAVHNLERMNGVHRKQHLAPHALEVKRVGKALIGLSSQQVRQINLTKLKQHPNASLALRRIMQHFVVEHLNAMRFAPQFDQQFNLVAIVGHGIVVNLIILTAMLHHNLLQRQYLVRIFGDDLKHFRGATATNALQFHHASSLHAKHGVVFAMLLLLFVGE